MGLKREYQCPACKYSEVVSGGEDCGMICSTVTITCAECKKLYDVVTSSRDGDDEKLPWQKVDVCCPTIGVTLSRCGRLRGHVRLAKHPWS